MYVERIIRGTMSAHFVFILINHADNYFKLFYFCTSHKFLSTLNTIKNYINIKREGIPLLTYTEPMHCKDMVVSIYIP